MIRYCTRWALLCQIVIGLSGLFWGCQNPNERATDLSEFYYPVDSWEPEGVIYRYESVRDSLLPYEVWQHAAHGESGLVSVNFDPQGRIVQRQFDRIVSNGVVIDSLILYFIDSVGREVREMARIHSPNRFPFQVTDSAQVWLTHLEWWQPTDSLRIVLQRRRQFTGFGEWDFKGQKIPAAKFSVRDEFETEEVGWSNSTWTGEEWYGKGYGLVYYRRNITQDLTLEYELRGIEHAQ